MPKTAGMQLLLRIRNSPGALTLRATRGLLTTTRYAEPGVSIEESGDLSNDRLNCSGGRVGRRIQAQRFDRIHQTEQLPECKTKISHHMN